MKSTYDPQIEVHCRPRPIAYVVFHAVIVIGLVARYLLHDALNAQALAALLGIRVWMAGALAWGGAVLIIAYIAENLFRSYYADDIGITVFRAFLPPARYAWEDFSGLTVYGHGDALVLHNSGGHDVSVMIDALTRGDELSWLIRRKLQKL